MLNLTIDNYTDNHGAHGGVNAAHGSPISMGMDIFNLVCFALGVPTNVIAFAMTFWLTADSSGIVWIQSLAIMETVYALENIRVFIDTNFCE